MVVASVARLVSVFVGAEVSVTLMFGYFASKSLDQHLYGRPTPLVLIGLAHQAMVPDVALPGAAEVPLDGLVVVVPVVPLLLLLLLLLQPAAAIAPTAPTRAASCQLRRERLAAYLLDLARAMCPLSSH